MTGFIRRRPLGSLLLILLIALLGWIWHERVALWAFPDIISAYTAKAVSYTHLTLPTILRV